MLDLLLDSVVKKGRNQGQPCWKDSEYFVVMKWVPARKHATGDLSG